MPPWSYYVNVLLHPIAFVRNFIRTIRIMGKTYKDTELERKMDGLVVKMRKPLDPEGPFYHRFPLIAYPGYKPHSEILPKGSRRNPHNIALPCDIFLEKDVCVIMRDGTKLYGDVYRPVTSSESAIGEDEQVPAILHWAPYGKESNSEKVMDSLPERLGVPRATYSGYEAWEGADPAYWVARGYAVVDVDARGSWNSEGDMYFWGKPDELDGYDTVEWLGRQPWCNGKVGLAGNSWLAISQWFIASARPPSLGAIAPWEGQTDSYRDQARRGGRPDSTMSHGRGMFIPGRGLQEDAGRMIETNELWNDYWEDKRAKVGKIVCPIYALASYSSKLHGIGTVRGWREAASKEKWLRFHPWFEWYDWPNYQDDLAKFFDYFLKGIKNDWPSTPKVRLSMLGFKTIPDVINRPLSTYPPPEMKQKVYYLNALTNTASLNPISKEASLSYPAADMKSEVHFDIVFDKYTELAGYAKLTVHMQCFEHNDMDIFVLLQKINEDGKALRHVNYPNTIPQEDLPLVNVVQYQGPFGNLRASHRMWKARGPSYAEPIPIPDGVGEGEVWDGDRELWHPHMKAERVPPGEIVKVEFTTWPMGSIYRKGEGLRVRISGRDICFIEASALPENPTQNVGTHVLHTGGKYSSSVSLPVLGG